MNQLSQLSSLEDLRKVVVITHAAVNGLDQLKMFYSDDDGALSAIRWNTSSDDELYSCTRNTVIDAIIPLMKIVTGKNFQRTSSQNCQNIFKRDDYIEDQKTVTNI